MKKSVVLACAVAMLVVFSISFAQAATDASSAPAVTKASATVTSGSTLAATEEKTTKDEAKAERTAKRAEMKVESTAAKMRIESTAVKVESTAPKAVKKAASVATTSEFTLAATEEKTTKDEAKTEREAKRAEMKLESTAAKMKVESTAAKTKVESTAPKAVKKAASVAVTSEFTLAAAEEKTTKDEAKTEREAKRAEMKLESTAAKMKVESTAAKTKVESTAPKAVKKAASVAVTSEFTLAATEEKTTKDEAKTEREAKRAEMKLESTAAKMKVESTAAKTKVESTAPKAVKKAASVAVTSEFTLAATEEKTTKDEAKTERAEKKAEMKLESTATKMKVESTAAKTKVESTAPKAVKKAASAANPESGGQHEGNTAHQTKVDLKTSAKAEVFLSREIVLAASATTGTVTMESPAATVAPTPAPGAMTLEAKLAATEKKLDATERRVTELEATVNKVCGTVSEHEKSVYSLGTELKQLETRSRQIPVEPTGLQLKPYGYIKIDVARDSHRTNSVEQPVFVTAEKPGFADGSQFTITARQTRIGLDIIGPIVGEAKNTGKLEMDFYGNVATLENKPIPMLRQAYWQLTYPNWNLLVGQTWEVVSPLFPNMLNYPALADSGNPGYRRPMVRYERTDPVFGDKILKSDIAIARGIGPGISGAAAPDDEASNSGLPLLEAREGISFPTDIGKTDKTPGRPVTIGVSGAVGQLEYDPVVAGAQVAGTGTRYGVYLANLDWTVPVAAPLDWTGEFWTGRNTGGFLGSIGQFANRTNNNSIDSVGGWTQLSYRPVAKWLFSVGTGIDQNEGADLSVNKNENRAFNASYFTNAIYSINEKTTVGVELSYFQTRYHGAPTGDDVRVQSALQYNF